MRSIWPKLVSLTPERARVWVRLPDDEIQWFKAPADLALFFEDGSELTLDLRQAALAKLQSQWDQVIDQIGLANIPESIERKFEVFWRPFSVIVGGQERRLFARKEDVAPPQLHPIEQVQLTGRAAIEVQEVTLTHMRLGETRVAYGEVTLKGRPGVVVASDGSGDELLSIRVSGAVVSTERMMRTEESAPPFVPR